jgi:hypothetical protein
MMRRLVCFFWLVAWPLFASILPYFPRVDQSFSLNRVHENALAFVFNAYSLQPMTTSGVALAHQNREWDYNWFVLGGAISSPIGQWGMGYSNYGVTTLPVTASDGIGSYISGVGSDTFETVSLVYRPDVSWVNIALYVMHKRRKLMDQSAHATHVDVAVSSSHILNHQLGVKTHHWFGTDYKWSDGVATALPRYIGIYYIQPLSPFTAAVSYDACVNDSSLSTVTSTLIFELDTMIHLFFEYQFFKDNTAVSFGSAIQLSDMLELRYAHRNEHVNYGDQSHHSLGIGVEF